ncbi:MAG: phosphate ABC transporter permease subunit PstC, partial [Paracoccaceae bacterium]
MPAIWLILIVFVLATVGYLAGRARALAGAGGNMRKLHSLPSYYGTNVSLFTVVPAVSVLVVWLLAQPLVVDKMVSGALPQGAVADGSTVGLVMSDVRRIADGLDLAVAQGVMSPDQVIVQSMGLGLNIADLRDQLGQVGVALGADVTAPILQAAQHYRSLTSTGHITRTIVVVLLALAGFGLSLMRTSPDFRARNVVEFGIKVLLMFAASLAILTTLGIGLSLVFNTIEFFSLYRASDFFFGTHWSPSFSGRGGMSELGILPLLWGTFYISIVALAVSVPIGLFAAIYLSEYASPRVRSIAKPMIEVLAGIPTIVYGLFALLTVGPLLLSVFGDDGLGVMQAGTAVMTAGLVMGVMLIPFVSSLSDDIINAVPQSLRDGSYGLGATQSETIKQVVLPAALPGIVGAILLAASRAI